MISPKRRKAVMFVYSLMLGLFMIAGGPVMPASAESESESWSVHFPLIARSKPARTCVQANSASSNASISEDGRYIAFESWAGNLVPGDTNRWPDIFIHDRETGRTTRVSVSSTGLEANDWSSFPSISADGRFLAFVSRARSLVPDDTNGEEDVFVHDLQTGETSRVSVSSAGEQANGGAVVPSISGDGRHIAFISLSTNLVPGISNPWGNGFVHDQLTGTTALVSVPADGASGTGASLYGSISLSRGGRYVAFGSTGYLTPNDPDSFADIFVHDRLISETTLVSMSTAGESGYGMSWDSSISPDGQHVAFESEANNLTVNDTNGMSDIFVHDRKTGVTTRVSLSANGIQGNGDSVAPSISGDGRFVAFESDANNLVPNDANYETDVFVRDLHRGGIFLVSVSSAGEQGNGMSHNPSISADGRYIAFESEAENLVAGDTNRMQDIFVYDRHTGQTTRVSVSCVP